MQEKDHNYLTTFLYTDERKFGEFKGEVPKVEKCNGRQGYKRKYRKD